MQDENCYPKINRPAKDYKTLNKDIYIYIYSVYIYRERKRERGSER